MSKPLVYVLAGELKGVEEAAALPEWLVPIRHLLERRPLRYMDRRVWKTAEEAQAHPAYAAFQAMAERVEFWSGGAIGYRRPGLVWCLVLTTMEDVRVAFGYLAKAMFLAVRESDYEGADGDIWDHEC